MQLLLWREQEPATVQSQFQQQHHQPWYSLLSCRLLSFIGGGGPTALNGEEYTTAKAVVSSHRLSFDHRLSHDHRLSQEQRVSLSSTRCESPPPSQKSFLFSEIVRVRCVLKTVSGIILQVCVTEGCNCWEALGLAELVLSRLHLSSVV